MATLLSANAFCQQRSAEEYNIKSRHLRNAGLVLVSAGGTLTIEGNALIAGDHNNINSNNTLSSQTAGGVLLVTLGVASILGSIPLFIVSGAMHKKAARITRGAAFLEMEKVPSASVTGIHLQPFPALGIRIVL